VKKDPEWYVIWDPDTGECIEVLDANVSCNPYVGMDYAGHCGGCDNCMLMQADYGGLKVERLVLQAYETVGDAVGRRQEERRGT